MGNHGSINGLPPQAKGKRTKKKKEPKWPGTGISARSVGNFRGKRCRDPGCLPLPDKNREAKQKKKKP